ncbi:hypothetical protein RHGRI_030829 [Rhododendron griersonianum]|uniref:Uncharacterized protein n=1 Tax=Rhododendron griersonianum TaxID=479676 RepID=A0AAV6I622_9ERIC|nr:hypothetical protein RHGRI_030829 [Rhododendron griersonianum]
MISRFLVQYNQLALRVTTAFFGSFSLVEPEVSHRGFTQVDLFPNPQGSRVFTALLGSITFLTR